MTVFVWVMALVAAALHVVVFVWESLLIERPGVHSGVFSVPTAEVPAIRLWAFGVGFYNLFLACGLIAGVALWAGGARDVGRALILYICLFMVLSGVVLFVADRLAMGRPRGTGVIGALGQGVPPLLALIGLALS